MTTASTFLRSAFDRIIAARQRQAERYVARYLITADDETLRSHGLGRAELRKRAGSVHL